jgi:hypothetical protein
MGSSGNAERGSVEIELKGKKYTVLELSLKDLADIENFVKAKYARLYRESAVGLKQKDIEKAVKEILRTRYDPKELGEEMDAFDVQHYMIYVALRSNPGITIDGLDDIVSNDGAVLVVNALDSFTETDAGEDEGNPPGTEKKN